MEESVCKIEYIKHSHHPKLYNIPKNMSANPMYSTYTVYGVSSVIFIFLFWNTDVCFCCASSEPASQRDLRFLARISRFLNQINTLSCRSRMIFSDPDPNPTFQFVPDPDPVWILHVRYFFLIFITKMN
jgi:hypothetical protein